MQRCRRLALVISVSHGCLLLVFVFEACIISVLKVAAAAAAPSEIVVHIILFVILLWRHLLLVVVVAVLDHFIAHYGPITVDWHAVVVSSAGAADLVVLLV